RAALDPVAEEPIVAVAIVRAESRRGIDWRSRRIAPFPIPGNLASSENRERDHHPSEAKLTHATETLPQPGPDRRGGPDRVEAHAPSPSQPLTSPPLAETQSAPAAR